MHHRPSTTTSNTHQGRIRVLMRREDPSPSGLTSGRDGKNEFDFPGLVGNIRSELFIQGTGPADNGTYRCQAENKAATATSNFTLHVTDRAEGGTLGGGTIMQVIIIKSFEARQKKMKDVFRLYSKNNKIITLFSYGSSTSSLLPSPSSLS